MNDGRIVDVVETYDRLRQPGRPIPPDITRLTGIDDALVAGQVIDPDAVARFVEPAALLIAYISNFDRRFAERFCPAFVSKLWACEGISSGQQRHVSLCAIGSARDPEHLHRNEARAVSN